MEAAQVEGQPLPAVVHRQAVDRNLRVVVRQQDADPISRGVDHLQIAVLNSLAVGRWAADQRLIVAVRQSVALHLAVAVHKIVVPILRGVGRQIEVRPIPHVTIAVDHEVLDKWALAPWAVVQIRQGAMLVPVVAIVSPPIAIVAREMVTVNPPLLVGWMSSNRK